jgi:hypothetical protein
MSDKPTVPAKGLESVHIGLHSPETAFMVLTNVNHKRTGYLFGPEGLEVLLGGLLPLLNMWSQHPELAKERISGKGNAIAATRVVIQNGRSGDEAALFVQFGTAHLIFLLPAAAISTTIPIQPWSGPDRPVH